MQPMPDIRVDADRGDVEIVHTNETRAIGYKNVNTLMAGAKRYLVGRIFGRTQEVKSALPEQSMLSDTDLRACYEYLAWQYQRQEVRMAEAGVIQMLVAEGTSTEEGLMAIWEVREQMAESLFYIIPVHGDKPLHWTCIIVKTRAREHGGRGGDLHRLV